jgi:hypothetical protein
MDSWTDYLLAIISPIHQTEMLAKTISEPVMNMAYGAKGALEQQKLDEFVRQNTDFADYGEFMDELHRRQGMDVVDMSGSSSSQLYIRRTANGTSGAASLYVTVVTSRVPASKICSTGIKAVENGVPKGGLPELRISAGKYPELAENILHAQRAGHPEVLTHGGEAVIDANRNAALHQPYRDFVPNIGNGLTRDEYPFASSMEGGAGAWVGHIPKDQQNAQGGLIRAMNLKPGDQYRVVIVP